MKIYHKPSCITCKRVMAGMRQSGECVEARDIFKYPLSESEIAEIVRMSGKRPSDLLRKRDKMYRELGLGGAENTDSQIIKLMAQYPGLIMRPIIVAGGRAYVGRKGQPSP